MELGVNVQVRPVAGDTVAVRVTVPVNPPTRATVIVDVPAAPARMVTLVGLAVMAKSCTPAVKVTVVVWDSVPLAPVTVTV